MKTSRMVFSPHFYLAIFTIVAFFLVIFVTAKLFEAHEPYYFSDTEKGEGNLLVYPGGFQTNFGRDDLPQGWYLIEKTQKGGWRVLGLATEQTLNIHVNRTQSWTDCTPCGEYRLAWFWGGDH